MLAQETQSHALGPAKTGLEPLLELALSGGGSARQHASHTLERLARGGERSALAALAASDAAIAWFVSRLRGGGDAGGGDAGGGDAGGGAMGRQRSSLSSEAPLSSDRCFRGCNRM